MLNILKYVDYKIIFGFLFLILFCNVSVSDSFGEFPSDTIEITIENVTINNPESSSSGDSGSENKFLEVAITQGLSVIGIVITATVGAVFAYINRGRVPTTLDQEKLFNDIMKEAYYESYLPIWRDIWEIVNSHKGENKYKIIDYLWMHYFGKRQLPTRDALKQMQDPDNLPDPAPLPKTPEDARKEFVSYAILKAKNFHLNSINKEEKIMEQKLKYLFNASDAEYYHSIPKKLPTFVERAVMATNDPKKYKTLGIVGLWQANALKALKQLMIFAFLREDEEVLKLMIDAEIAKISKQQ